MHKCIHLCCYAVGVELLDLNLCSFISTHLQVLDLHMWQLRVIKSLSEENPPWFYCAAVLLAHFVGFPVQYICL